MTRDDLFERLGSQDALRLLKEGNRRFAQDAQAFAAGGLSQTRRLLAEKGQAPFAVIVGCSDSRVPPELAFDVGLGQLFVVRTAGNVADAIAIGSVEYAVAHLGCQLVVVLGHRQCGAVAAAIDGGDHGPNIAAIIAEIEPSLKAIDGEQDAASLCEDQNIRHTVGKLSDSQVLAASIAAGSLTIVGAKYDLASGVVDFWD
jgi:carbonic anhydrase